MIKFLILSPVAIMIGFAIDWAITWRLLNLIEIFREIKKYEYEKNLPRKAIFIIIASLIALYGQFNTEYRNIMSTFACLLFILVAICPCVILIFNSPKR